MEQNKTILLENEKTGLNDRGMRKQKTYLTPSIKKIGGINEKTLSGGPVVVADSGSLFSPS
jgi:hypothetical protein